MFDTDAFMRYIFENCNGQDSNAFARDLIENLISYGLDRPTRDSLPYFLSDIIPGLSFAEAAMFCGDSMLTSNGKAAKRAEREKRRI